MREIASRFSISLILYLKLAIFEVRPPPRILRRSSGEADLCGRRLAAGAGGKWSECLGQKTQAVIRSSSSPGSRKT